MNLIRSFLSSSCVRSKAVSSRSPRYETLEPRNLLAGNLWLGPLNSGIAVADDATGAGFIMFSDDNVQNRFEDVGADNANHLIAVRMMGNQWQYNNDAEWRNFSPVEKDLLVGEINFDSNKVATLHGKQSVINGIEYGFVDGDLWFAANTFGGVADPGEIGVHGDSLYTNMDMELTQSQSNLRELARATLNFQEHHDQLPNIAIFDSEGKPLLSWRVQLLPFLGMEDLYDQFNLDEPWNSPNNLSLVEQMPVVFESNNVTAAGKTTFFAIGGDGTVFPLTSEKIHTQEIAYGGDGLANTLLYVEADAERATDWTKPYDLTFNVEGPLSGLGRQGDFAAVSVDGRPYQIPSTIDPLNFANLVLRDDGNFVDFSDIEPVTSRDDSFTTVSNGIDTYRKVFGRFPAHAIYSNEGTPLLSWRVAILPYIGHKNLYDQFNLQESWDSPANLPLLDQIPNVFASEGLADGMTNWLAMSGPGTMFEIVDDEFYPNDGFSNTILFVEADLDQAVEWSKPQDLLFDPADPRNGLNGLAGNGFYGAFSDGNVEFVNSSISDANLINLSLRDNGGFVDFSEFAPYQTAQENLRALGLGVLNFERWNQELPRHAIYADDGVPLLSWRVGILPYIEQGDLFDQFHLDEAWDSPHNLTLLPLMPRIYASPNVDHGFTVFVTSNGENTAFPYADQRVRLNSFVDGAANTALILQANEDDAVEWTRPMDLMFDEANPRDGWGLALQSGSHFVRADGSLGFLPGTVSDADVASLLQRNDEVPFVDFDAPPTFFELRQTVSNRARQAALGAQNYHDAHGKFPAHAIYSLDGSTPLLSWRVAILPFLGHAALFEQFNLNEPWDSANNIALLPLMPDVFAHPELENGLTALLGVTGENTIFRLENLGYSLETIPDGPSNTIMFLQANQDQAVEWTRPIDLEFSEADPKFGTGELFPTGTVAAMADASAHFLHDCIEPGLMRNLVLANDGNQEQWDLYCNNGTTSVANYFGTQGDDSINVEFAVDNLVIITINGEETILPRDEFDQIFIDGLAGDDRLTISSSLPETDTVGSYSEMRVDRVFFQNGSTQINVANTEVNTLHGGNGPDEVKIFGTDGDEVFAGAEFVSSMSGSGFIHTVNDFETVVAKAEQGNDVARLEDSAGNDELFTDLMFGALHGPSRNILRAIGFDILKVDSMNGGNDRATFNLSNVSQASDELALVTPEYIRVINGEGNVLATGFKSVFIDGDDGQDVIRITDSVGDDVFGGQQQKGTFRSPERVVRYEGFEKAILTSINGGRDTANLKSIGFTDDRFFAQPGLATLRGADIDFRLVGFQAIDVQGRGGIDFARLIGSEGNDQFFANKYRASLKGDGYLFSISGFRNVLATAGTGGQDSAVLRDSTRNDRLTANWNRVMMRVNGTVNQAENFQQVTAISSTGNDVAILNDSEGDDTFFSNPERAYLRGEVFYNIAKGFSRVTAFSTVGSDKAVARDSAGDDVFVGTPSQSYLRGDGFHNTGVGFADFRVFATAGGSDVAYLSDSEGDDIFSGSGDTGWMRGAAHFYLTRGFDVINARGYNGGVNIDYSRNVNYQLNLNGDWN